MKYGNDDQAHQGSVEDENRRMNRRIRLGMMDFRNVRREFNKVKAAHPDIELENEPCTRVGYAFAIQLIEDRAAGRVPLADEEYE